MLLFSTYETFVSGTNSSIQNIREKNTKNVYEHDVGTIVFGL